MTEPTEKREPAMWETKEAVSLDEWNNPRMEGTLECMYYAAAAMFHLGSYLMPGDKKLRVTIECDPETGRFRVKREELN